MGPKVTMGPSWIENPLCPGGPGQLDTFAPGLVKKGKRSGCYSKSWGPVKLGEQQHPQRCCVSWWQCVTCFQALRGTVPSVHRGVSGFSRLKLSPGDGWGVLQCLATRLRVFPGLLKCHQLLAVLGRSPCISLFQLLSFSPQEAGKGMDPSRGIWASSPRDGGTS